VKAPVEIPVNRRGWWGGDDRRPRCTACGKVVIADRETAEHKAATIRARGSKLGDDQMRAYLGRCGHWHLTSKGHTRAARVASPDEFDQ